VSWMKIWRSSINFGFARARSSLTVRAYLMSHRVKRVCPYLVSPRDGSTQPQPRGSHSHSPPYSVPWYLPSGTNLDHTVGIFSLASIDPKVNFKADPKDSCLHAGLGLAVNPGISVTFWCPGINYLHMGVYVKVRPHMGLYTHSF
jgi:hypothetical protein